VVFGLMTAGGRRELHTVKSYHEIPPLVAQRDPAAGNLLDEVHCLGGWCLSGLGAKKA